MRTSAGVTVAVAIGSALRVPWLFLLPMLSASASYSRAAETYFEEGFDTTTPNPSLEGYEGFIVENGGIHRTSGTPDDSQRRYLRTVRADYNTKDFVYEVTFTSGPHTITFIGVGHGAPDSFPNEPANSMNFRIHPPDLANGDVDVGETIGHLMSMGPHRARIEKVGNRISFFLDTDFDGEFKPDMERTFTDILGTFPFIKTGDTHVFFGSGNPQTVFDDLSIYSPHVTKGSSGNYYEVVDARAIPWADARKRADESAFRTFTGHLATITSDKEESFLVGLLRQEAQGAVQMWVGAFQPDGQAAPDDGWEWVNGEGPVPTRGGGAGYAGWLDGEPNDCCGTPAEDNEENYAALFVEGNRSGWNDVHTLEDINGYIVEYETQATFWRGDVNGDGRLNIVDPVLALNYLFGDANLTCLDAADADDDGNLNVTDAIFLLGYMFLGTAIPPPPFDHCGVDPRDDQLTCESQSRCL